MIGYNNFDSFFNDFFQFPESCLYGFGDLKKKSPFKNI